MLIDENLGGADFYRWEEKKLAVSFLLATWHSFIDKCGANVKAISTTG
jgi:hypothetical protein